MLSIVKRPRAEIGCAEILPRNCMPMTSNALAGEQCNRHTRGDNNKDERIGHKDMLTVQNQNQSARLLISRTKDAAHLIDSPSHASRL